MALLFMESASLVCDDQQMIAVYLSLDMLKLPAIEKATLDYMPGGSPGGIQIPVMVAPPVLEFALAGWQPGVQRLVGSPRRYTARGLIRDQMTRRAVQGIAIVEGEITRVNPSPFTKGAKMGHEYQIQGVTHYEVSADDKLIWLWDFFTCEFIAGDGTIAV